MLLIPPNEHNLEGRLSSYICGLGGVESEWKRREKLCCSLRACSLSTKLQCLFSPSAVSLNGGNRKPKRCLKFRFSSKLITLYTAHPLAFSLSGCVTPYCSAVKVFCCTWVYNIHILSQNYKIKTHLAECIKWTPQLYCLQVWTHYQLIQELEYLAVGL